MTKMLPCLSWVLLVAGTSLALLGCGDGDERPPMAPWEEEHPAIPTGGDPCAHPAVGCPCDEPGESVACGLVTQRSGDYITCSNGNRECLSDGVWGDCSGGYTTTQYAPRPPTNGHPSRRTLAQVTDVCEDNPCDPYCNFVEVDGDDLTDLPPGICPGPEGGVIVCEEPCAYAGPHGAGGYDSLPAAWRQLPSSCTAAADACSYDRDCSPDGECATWNYPCYDPDPPGCTLTTKLDLELGPPCMSGGTFHIQVCNRGAHQANSGTIQVGIYSDRALLSTTVPVTSPVTPDKGTIRFALGSTAGRYIDPGKCIDLTPSNTTSSTSPAPDGTGMRALAVNYDGSIPECNYANNWQVFDPDADCTGCRGLECNQTCPSANVTGIVRDPAGNNPVPGVVVYVPNDPVLPLDDGVQCDTCTNLYTGTPIASTITAADGTFTLTNVPTNEGFTVVVQTGRWRRIVNVSPITGACGSGTPTRALPPADTRLPRNKLEGNIPKMALSMSAGDHLECLLRKIGIENSEFTVPSSNGRVHLYAYNGMTFPGTDCPNGAARTNSTCANYLWSTPARLDQYNIVIAPCDKASSGKPYSFNSYVGCESSSSSCPGRLGYAGGPFDQPGGTNAYGFPNTHAGFVAAERRTNPLNHDRPPFPTTPDLDRPNGPQPPNHDEQQNLRTYIDKGGRLFATHWMAHILTKDMYPESVNYDYGAYVDLDRNKTGTDYFPFSIDTASELGSLFSQWLGSSTVTFTSWRHVVGSVNAPTIRLAHGDSTQHPLHHPTCSAGPAPAYNVSPSDCSVSGEGWGGPQVSVYQFDTPWGVPPENQCGRVVVAESHVSMSRDPDQNTAFPSRCDMSAMTGEEKSFEFLLFAATQCVGLVAPPIVTLQPTTYTYDYEAKCPSGTLPEWEYFYWQATVPEGTSIDFEAQTARTKDELEDAPRVAIGTATTDTTIFTSDPNTVDWHLTHATEPMPNYRWLRISMTLNPEGTVSPTVDRWRQEYDCIPAE